MTKLAIGTTVTSQSMPWRAAFDARSDLEAYGDNAIGLFALALKFNLDDLTTVAADSITDGSDDKKCDIIFLNPDEGYATIAQCYFSTKSKSEAPANKASDLNTAINWLLQRDIDDLPERIRYQAQDLRAGIQDSSISHINVWYVHNLPESKNVASELKTVESTTHAGLKLHHSNKNVTVSALEVGSGVLSDWYNDTQSPILVSDSFKVYVDGGFGVSGPQWKGYVTSIPIQFLRKEYNKHKLKLFSANVRDYLGSKSSDSNINNGIKKSAENAPEQFWVYNNGVTILVNSFDEPIRMKSGRYKFTYNGMSIVNGAQTTGAVASLSTAPPTSAKVAVRFIQTDNQELVYDIIRFNNSQNKVTASDFRSTDTIQRRLREEMAKLPEAEYEGGRRGGPTDSIRRRPKLLASYTVGQALAALHGDATVGYNQRAEIWSNDTLYARYFNEHTTAAHLVFAYSLLRAIEAKKVFLINKSKATPEAVTESDERQLAFFRRRGSTFLFLSALASCLEIFCGKKMPNLFRVSFGLKTSPTKAAQFWSELVELNLPLSLHLEEAFTHGLQNQERVKSAIQTFRSLVEATAAANRPAYKRFASAVVSQ